MLVSLESTYRHPHEHHTQIDEEHKSLRLLVGTELPIGQIAAMIGMNKQASFTRAARRWWQATPSQMRQRRR